MSFRRQNECSPRSVKVYTTSALGVSSTSFGSPVSADYRSLQEPDLNALKPPTTTRTTTAAKSSSSRMAMRQGKRHHPATARSALSATRLKAKGSPANGDRAAENGSADGAQGVSPTRDVPGAVEVEAEPNNPPKLLVAQELRSGRSRGENAPSPRVRISHARANSALTSRHSVSPSQSIREHSQAATALSGDFESSVEGTSRSQSVRTAFSAFPRGPVVTEMWARSIVQPLDEYLLYTRNGVNSLGYEELVRQQQALQLREQRAQQRIPQNRQFAECLSYSCASISTLRRMRKGEDGTDTLIEEESEMGPLGEEEERARTIQLHERYIIERGTPLLFRSPRRRLFVDESDNGMKSNGGKMDESNGYGNAEDSQLFSSKGQRISAITEGFMASSFVSKRNQSGGAVSATKRPLLLSQCADGSKTNTSINNGDANCDSSVNSLFHGNVQCEQEYGAVSGFLDSNGGESSSSAVVGSATLVPVSGTSSLLPDEHTAADLLNDPLFALTGEENFERLMLVQEEHEERKFLYQKGDTATTNPQCPDGDGRSVTFGSKVMDAQSESSAPRGNSMRFEQPRPIQSPQQQQRQGKGGVSVEQFVSVASSRRANKQSVDSTVAMSKKKTAVDCKKRLVQYTETHATPVNIIQQQQQQQGRQVQPLARDKRAVVRAVKRENGRLSFSLQREQEKFNSISESHLHEVSPVHQSVPVPTAPSLTLDTTPSPTSKVHAVDDFSSKTTPTSANVSPNENATLSCSKPPLSPPKSNSPSPPTPHSSDVCLRHAVDASAWSTPYPAASATPSPARERAPAPSPHLEPVGKEPPRPGAVGGLRPELPCAATGASPVKPSSVLSSPSAVSSAGDEEPCLAGTNSEEEVELREFLRFAKKEQRVKGNDTSNAGLFTALRQRHCARAKQGRDIGAVTPYDVVSERDESTLLYGGGQYTQNVACILSTFGQMWRSTFHENMCWDELPAAVQGQLLFFNIPTENIH